MATQQQKVPAMATEIKPVKDVKSVIAELNKKLPDQFGVKCTKCGEAKKVRKDVYLKRVEKLQGDVTTMVTKYICAKCRKEHSVDLIGRPKVAGGATKILTLDDVKLS